LLALTIRNTVGLISKIAGEIQHFVWWKSVTADRIEGCCCGIFENNFEYFMGFVSITEF
jgi:hypothetical protein